MSKIDFYQVAQFIMFGGKTTERDLLEKFNLDYRKGKKADDIVKAIKKSYKYGNARTEDEIGMLELYLKDVFKLTAKK